MAQEDFDTRMSGLRGSTGVSFTSRAEVEKVIDKRIKRLIQYLSMGGLSSADYKAANDKLRELLELNSD